MPVKLDDALAEVRELLLDPGLVRAVAAGRRRGQTPSLVRAELRPVTLKSGPHLQIVTSDGARPHTRNVAGADAGAAVDSLLAEPFGNWHVETGEATVQLRVTKKGDAQVHRATATREAPDTQHDRAKEYRHPVLSAALQRPNPDSECSGCRHQRGDDLPVAA